MHQSCKLRIQSKFFNVYETLMRVIENTRVIKNPKLLNVLVLIPVPILKKEEERDETDKITISNQFIWSVRLFKKVWREIS